jgi:hypothetical protein
MMLADCYGRHLIVDFSRRLDESSERDSLSQPISVKTYAIPRPARAKTYAISRPGLAQLATPYSQCT